MINVTGMVVEELRKAGSDPNSIDSICDLLDDPNCMSESDWCNAGLDRGAAFTKKQRCEIESVIDPLSGPLWSQLLVQGRRLIIESASQRLGSQLVRVID
jgi:hypothetical protein